jgi:FkbM family methyltransferase
MFETFVEGQLRFVALRFASLVCCAVGQCFEEEWVLNKLNNKREGYFIDSGACDGVYLSNTLKLEKEFGWNGICVEPLPSFIETLKRVRECNIIQCGLDTTERTFKLRDAHANSRLEDSGSIEVQCYTIGTVLKMFQAPSLIDYWSLDIEGNELSILESFPWDSYHINCLSVEHNTNVSEENEPGLAQRLINRTKIHELLKSKGFIWEKSVICDDFFYNENIRWI